MKKANEELKEALKDGKLSKMKDLLKKGADPNYRFKNKDKEFSLLHMAVYFEDLPYVKLLVENGADINKLEFTNGKKNPFGDLTPLQYSILNGTNEPDNYKVINFLLKSNANAYIKNKNGNNSRDIAKYRNKKDKIKKYLSTIDKFYLKNKKMKDTQVAIANKTNTPIKKISTKKKSTKKVNTKNKRKMSIKGGSKKKKLSKKKSNKELIKNLIKNIIN